MREADYAQPATLVKAFADATKVLLISSSEVGKRALQHAAVIEAAKASGVKLLAYASILHAPTSKMGLAAEHRETEALLQASGLPHVLLRNGWYTENFTGSIGAEVSHGVVLGAAGNGRIASATRADYAAAAAAVLVTEGQAGKVYELAGDDAFTLTEYAAEVSRQSGKPVIYKDIPETACKDALVGVGVPGPFAALLAQCSACSADGDLYDDRRDLSGLICRPTTPLSESAAEALSGAIA